MAKKTKNFDATMKEVIDAAFDDALGKPKRKLQSVEEKERRQKEVAAAQAAADQRDRLLSALEPLAAQRFKSGCSLYEAVQISVAISLAKLAGK